MGRARKVVIGLGIVALIGLAAFFLVARSLGGWGKLDDWVGRQLLGVVSSYIVPAARFESLTYIPPYSVRLSTVTFTSPDGVEVVRIDKLNLTLAEIPREGHPIRIKSVEFQRPRLNLILEPGDDLAFKGLLPFTKHKPGEPDEDVPEEFRLSNVLQLDKVAIEDGQLLLDLGGGELPITLAGLTLDLDVDTTVESGATWHTLDLSAGRPPGLVLDLQGRVNLDTMDIDLAEGRFDMTVSPETIASLPPALQQLIAPYESRGHLLIQASGSVPGLRMEEATIDATLALRDAFITLDEFCTPVESLDVALAIDEGRTRTAMAEAKLFAGTFSAAATGDPVNPSDPLTINWSVYNWNLREMLRKKDEEDPKIAGILTASGQASARPQEFPETLRGSGVLKLREARLVNLPTLRKIFGSLLKGRETDRRNTHEADADFALTPVGVDITRGLVNLGFNAARVRGLFAYDGRLDLEVNAGPLEKVQTVLGSVGSLIGKLTDQIVTYRVTGSVGNPTVTVQPLGIGSERTIDPEYVTEDDREGP